MKNKKENKKENNKSKKGSIRHLFSLSLLSLFTIATSGGIAYFAMDKITYSNKNNNFNDYEIPNIDSNDDNTDNGFSKTINSLLQAKEITDGDIKIEIKPKNTDTITFSLSNLDLDMSKLNTTIINLSTDLNVKYNGIDQSLNMRIENNEDCFVSIDNLSYTQNNKKANFLFSAPQTLSDVISILRELGILIPDSTSSISSAINLTSMMSDMQSYLDKLTVSEEKTLIDDNVQFDISLDGGLEIDNVKIENISLSLIAEKTTLVKDGEEISTYKLVGLKTNSTDGISIFSRNDSSKEYEKLIDITLDGTLNVNDVSGYQTISDNQRSEYSSITDANSSILSTVTKLIGHSTDLGIEVDVDKTVTDSAGSDLSSSSFLVSGLMQAKVNTGDFKNGIYSLSLNHLSDSNSDEELNSLYAYHSGDNTYLKFNELIKAKVSNTTVSDLFSLISEGTGKKAIEVISSQLDSTLGNLDINSLKDGDYSSIQGLLDSSDTFIDFEDDVLHIGIDGKYLGITDNRIDINIGIDNTSNQIRAITVSGLTFTSTDDDLKTSKITAKVIMTVKKSTDFIVPNDGEYSDYKGTVPLFDEICSIIGEKKFFANYSLTFNDKINDGSNSYSLMSANGSISADLSKVSNKKLLDGISDGTYSFSMHANSSNGSYSHNLDMKYVEKNLYFGYDTINSTDNSTLPIFRNYISDAQLGEMNDILNSKTDSNVSSVLSSSSDILDTLGCNEDFKSDIEKIKKGSLKGLESFVSINTSDDENGNHLFNLKVDTEKIFSTDSILGKNIGAIILTLKFDNVENKLEFKDISISTVISSDQDFSFSLSFADYEDISVNKEDYIEITDASKLTSAFYNIPSYISKYGIKVDASYKKNAEYAENGTTLISSSKEVIISGGAHYDFTSSPIVEGDLKISHPYVGFENASIVNKQADQNIKFNYQKIEDENGVTDGQFIADYNDNMHIVMHDSSVSDIVSISSTMSETNLLNRLLQGGEQIASSMPIKDVISLKAPSLLLEYPYINNVDFDSTNNQIVLSVDRRLFNLSSEGKLLKVTITYDDGLDPTLTGVMISLDDNSLSLSAKISLVSYDSLSFSSVTEYNDVNKNMFVSLDGFSSLLKMMMNTTEFNYYHTSGYINLDLSLFNGKTQTPINLDAYSFDLNITLDLFVKDEAVYAYVSVAIGDYEFNENGYYFTEYAFKDDYVYINNTSTNAYLEDGVMYNNISSQAMKVTEREFKSNIIYYLISLGLNIDSRPMGKTIMANIYQSLNTETENSGDSDTLSDLTKDLDISLSDDFSSLLQAGALYNENKKQFAFNLDLNSLLSIKLGDTSLLSFSKSYLKLYHQTHIYDDGSTFTPLYAIQLSSNVSVLSGLLKVSFRAQFTSSANSGDLLYLDQNESSDVEVLKGKMKRFYTLTDYIDSNVASGNEFSLDEISLLHYQVFDFTSMELTDFYNDYSFSYSGSLLNASISTKDEDALASYLSSNEGILIYR